MKVHFFLTVGYLCAQIYIKERLCQEDAFSTLTKVYKSNKPSPTKLIIASPKCN